MSSGLFILLLGFVIYAGVVGSWVYEKKRIPDVLILIAIGLVMGPMLKLVSASTLSPWMPYVGSIALSLILFEGGLDLDFDQIVNRLGTAFLMATGSFFLNLAVIASIYRWFTGDPWSECMLVGSVLGCVSSAVILPVTQHLRAPIEVKTAMNLESAISDMWGVVIALVILRVTGGLFDAGHTVNAVIGSFTTAVVGAGIFGMAWLWVLDRLRESPFAYMMTLAAVFVVYGLTELVHGSGPIAALTFGLVLTNAPEIAALIGRKYKFTLDDTIRRFNTEVTFFARTFYFVYLGLVVAMRSFDMRFFAMALGVLGAIVLCRAAVVRATSTLDGAEKPYEVAYLAMVPRGLTSAVLAGMVYAAQRPSASIILELTFAVILATNILMTWLVYRYDKTVPERA